VRITQLIMALLILLLAGCNNDQGGSKTAYLIGQKPTTKSTAKPITKIEADIALTAMEAEHQEALATITAQKETKLQALALEKSKSADHAKETIAAAENQRKIAVEKERQQAAIIIQRDRSALYQQYLIAAVIALILIILLAYSIHRRNQTLKRALHEDQLRHKEYMLASQQQHERIQKTMEILASESTDKHLKKELVKLLKDQYSEQPKLLKHKEYL